MSKRSVANATFVVSHGRRPVCRCRFRAPTSAIQGDGARCLTYIQNHRSKSHHACRGEISQLVHSRGYATVNNKRYAVIGGGLTGLTTAYYLAKYLPPTARITLYESSSRLGGWIQTDHKRFRVEGQDRTVKFERGPRVFPFLGSEMWKFDDLVLTDLISDLGMNPRYHQRLPRYIYYPDHLVQPEETLGGLFSQFMSEKLFSGVPLSYIRYMSGNSKHEKPVPEEDLSVAAWLQSIGVSRTVVDNIVSAMMHGIHGGNVDELSARSVFDKLYWNYYFSTASEESLLIPKGEIDIIKTLAPENANNGHFIDSTTPNLSTVSFGEAGMQALPDALEHALQNQKNVTIKRSTAAKRVTFDERTRQVQVASGNNPRQLPENFDEVVSTISSQHTARITNKKLPSLAETRSTSIWGVNLWYPQPEKLVPPGFGYLIPTTVPRELNPERALGVFFDHYVEGNPDGTKLFVLLGGHYYDSGDVIPPADENEAIAQAEAVVERHLGISRDLNHVAFANLNHECIPQITVGHGDRMRAAARDLQRHFDGKLHLAGGSYTRPGLMGSLRAGFDVAREIVHPSDRLIGPHATGFPEYARIGWNQLPRSQRSINAFKKAKLSWLAI